ncbi:MAG: hypothetical protein WCK89_24955, partial [bacterium]
MLYAVAPDPLALSVLIWDPADLQGYFKLKELEEHVSDSSSHLDGLFALSHVELMERIRIRKALFLRRAQEPAELLRRVEPDEVLVLADTIPSPMFWHSLPEGTVVHIVAWQGAREAARKSAADDSLARLSPRIHSVDSPVALVRTIWKHIRRQPFPKTTAAILTGDSPLEIMNGLVNARAEGLPLLAGHVVTAGDGHTIVKVGVSSDQVSPLGKQVLAYPLKREARASQTPTCRWVIEESGSVGFVLALVHAITSGGQVFVVPPPTNDLVEESLESVRTISSLIGRGALDEARAELDHLKGTITNSISSEITESLEAEPQLPIQIVGTPYPYSLCIAPKSGLTWGKAFDLAFMPMADYSRITLRSVDRESERDLTVAIVSALDEGIETEAKDIADVLASYGTHFLTQESRTSTTSVL